ncbi:sigma-E processing peptidase SpoIIGA [Paenibacillus assamensis]|uniref:sigma-E processing peptidase SpoIIGA n=1 Tax=Paenibacillus assamensis TaxID=311244 RepID=UPI0004060921|nr:sigma-E processing peptidase SpoIIGA [Paenibacillus assamensis]
MTVIYADIILVTNFILDWTLLALTARMRSIRASTFRMLGAAALGTVYAGVLFFPTVPFLVTIGGKVLLSICMLVTAFGYQSFGNLVRNLGAFYFHAFVIAGGAFGIQYLWKDASSWTMFAAAADWASRQDLPTGGAIVVFGLVFALLIYKLAWGERKQQVHHESYSVELEVVIGSITRTCTGLIDTGNGLKEPLSGTPVIVMDVSLWEDVLPLHWKEIVKSGSVMERMGGFTDSDRPHESIFDESRMRLLPYRAVNQSNSWMLGFRPDYIRLKHGERCYMTKKVVIGLEGENLSQERRFQAIIHPELLEESLLQPTAGMSEVESTHKAS